MNTGFTWNTQDRKKDIVAAKKSWSIAGTMLKDKSYHLIVLDELTYAKLVQQEAEMMQSSKDSLEKVPTGIFVG
jgi:cob(I)alamin adenosyltransferase